MMKFYVHFEGQPEYTCIVQPLSQQQQLQSILDLKLDVKGKKLVDSTHLLKAIKNMDDVYVVKNNNTPTPDPVADVATSSKSSEVVAPAPAATAASTSSSISSQSTSKTETTSTISSASSASSPSQSQSPSTLTSSSSSTSSPAASTPDKKVPVSISTGCDPKYQAFVLNLLEQGNQLYDKQLYRGAVQYYENVLQVHPTEKTTLVRMATIYHKAEKCDKALKFIESAIKHHSKDKDHMLNVLYGNILTGVKEFEDAAAQFKLAANIMGKKHKDYLTTRALMAKAMYDTRIQSNQQEACEVLNEVKNTDEGNLQGLIGFAYVLIDNKRHNDALLVLMQLLSRMGNSGDRNPVANYTKEALADYAREFGAQQILVQLKDTLNTAPVLAFMSSVVKEYGAIEASVDFMKQALQMDPTNANYAHNVLHGLEVCNKYTEAINVFMKFLQTNKTRGLSNYKLTNGSILAILHKQQHIDYLNNPLLSLSYKRKMPDTGPIPVPKNLLDVAPDDQPTDAPYTKDDLDLMSLWFTIVKILYVLGILEPLPALISALEPLRKDRNLHLTVTRNEQAYFMCISQLMTFRELPIPNYPPIYIAGDSHSTVPAWTTCTIDGKPRLFHPLLTTGLKMWHLRPSSKFFPKFNFYAVTCTAPKGSEIVFQFGEIDCREGILVSVDKCRYNTIEEGIEVTIDIYIAALKVLIQKYNYKAYIHPVVPVLDQTRTMVKAFNKIFKEKVMKVKELVWLDFFDELLDSTGNGFNQEYAMDGTHMNPSYVRLVERTINDHYRSKQSNK
ncbi:hypothetical protein SAMD00019534_124490 [Acytostelium subglobosum LB1]|uniref:hypothetical protein n=1 Tax=Acytostelium subglobosum LB1 TaxID=1410327 RepID=UPI000644823E|nr:hypothetical protein SAMD00019534_124490 [Acytostelium subglobosum LB1]GAM29273.1 hypothetical protein SAMD00019534_124490 [Acytostelium subglobosum LB1]|eukprot:XP_012747771.1 hypothetical protein SAMD00019534_124490 [Acytostelium subglobosum LB1]